MNAARSVLPVALLVWIVVAQARPELPAAAREVLTQFDEDAADLDRKTEAEILKSRQRAVAALKKTQDEYTNQAKLDEATAVRVLVRLVEVGAPVALPPGTPAAVRKVYRDYEDEVGTLFEKGLADFVQRREKAATELQKIQDAFCKEAKLDEAVVVRDRIRSLAEPQVKALPDPGTVPAQASDVGRTLYYEVTGTGAAAGHAIYGSDVYVIGSHLGTAAVHCGLLKDNQKGVVRVTIVPTLDTFPGTTRNGVASLPSGRVVVAFKVERVYSFQARPFVDAFNLKTLRKKKE